MLLFLHTAGLQCLCWRLRTITPAADFLFSIIADELAIVFLRLAKKVLLFMQHIYTDGCTTMHFYKKSGSYGTYMNFFWLCWINPESGLREKVQMKLKFNVFFLLWHTHPLCKSHYVVTSRIHQPRVKLIFLIFF